MSSKVLVSWFSAGLTLSLAGCGEKIGEDKFDSISGTGGSSGDAESGGEVTTADTSTSNGSSSSATTTATTSPTSADESAGSESGPVDCSTCVAPPPEGWFGPVALYFGATGEPPPECSGAYGDSSLTLLSGYHDPGPAECACECELQSSFCTVQVYEHNSNLCQTYNEYIPVTETCVTNALTFGYINAYMYQQGNPYCQAMVTETIPEVEWDTLVSSCGMDEQLACDNGDVCVPPPPDGFDGAACIFQEGEVACPPGEFSVQKVFHTGVEDDRDCTNCGCGTGSGTCSGSIDMFASDDCSGNPSASAPAPFNQYGACTASAGAQSLVLNFTGSGSCPVMTMPMPEGSIAPVGPFTYCCMG